MSHSITTITFFKYQNFRQKIWAFGMMQFAHRPLQSIDGIRFYKLMGSGKGMGFHPLPDWSTYALLIVWENEEMARDFFKNSDLFQRYQQNTKERWTIFMKTITAKGSWSNQNPFDPHPDLDPNIPQLAIITRATIHWSKLFSFWKYVPTSQKPLLENEGLLYTKGIGEVPIRQMATFSIWKNKKSLKAFAYQSKEHRVAIQKTKALNWYSEEMFARFQPYDSIGTWEGKNIIKQELPQRS